jgi:hypothetical protein
MLKKCCLQKKKSTRSLHNFKEAKDQIFLFPAEPSVGTP